MNAIKTDLMGLWTDAVDRKYYGIRVLDQSSTSSIISSL